MAHRCSRSANVRLRNLICTVPNYQRLSTLTSVNVYDRDVQRCRFSSIYPCLFTSLRPSCRDEYSAPGISCTIDFNRLLPPLPDPAAQEASD